MIFVQESFDTLLLMFCLEGSLHTCIKNFLILFCSKNRSEVNDCSTWWRIWGVLTNDNIGWWFIQRYLNVSLFCKMIILPRWRYDQYVYLKAGIQGIKPWCCHAKDLKTRIKNVFLEPHRLVFSSDRSVQGNVTVWLFLFIKWIDWGELSELNSTCHKKTQRIHT